jgi:hypothetical protein
LKGGEERLARKLLEFQASISDIKQVNPLFSTCKVRVLYTGKNRNMSIITKDAVEKALPTLKNIPIVGEYSEEIKDYKGHGGKIDLDSYKYVHTTKPYGIVPESATYEWEEVKGKDGAIREYLTINGCYLWTGRYEEAYDVIENGKGQSMEIEVVDGRWDEEEEAYRIDNFIFSALCILGDDVEPAFEDASIMAYSLDKDSFKQEFSTMLKELKESILKEKEEKSVLKELLKKYSLTVEDLTEKGIKFDEISEDELEAKIIEVFEIEENPQPKDDEGKQEEEQEGKEEEIEEEIEEEDKKQEPKDDVTPEGKDEKGEDEVKDYSKELESRIKELEKELDQANNSLKEANKTIEYLNKEVESLREFKLGVEKKEHEAKVQEMFNNFQLNEADVEGIDIHAFSLEELEEKCYAILGRKLASKKNFSKSKDEGIRLLVGNDDQDKRPKPYGGLIEKYMNK